MSKPNYTGTFHMVSQDNFENYLAALGKIIWIVMSLSVSTYISYKCVIVKKCPIRVYVICKMTRVKSLLCLCNLPPFINTIHSFYFTELNIFFLCLPAALRWILGVVTHPKACHLYSQSRVIDHHGALACKWPWTQTGLCDIWKH